MDADSRVNDAIQDAVDQFEEDQQKAIHRFAEEFKRNIADPDTEHDLSRIQLLEQSWGKIRQESQVSEANFIQNMLKSINEKELTRSKKENLKRKG